MSNSPDPRPAVNVNPDVIVDLAGDPPDPPPPAATRCVRCRGPLVTYRGQPACETCDFFTLPADDEWLNTDCCGRDG